MITRPFTVEESHALRRRFVRSLDGKKTQVPEHIEYKLTVSPSRHRFAIRLREGLVIWFECWCNNPYVIEAKRRDAYSLAQKGFRCAFLDTRFSTRWVGERRPLLVTVPHSAVNFERVAEQLLTNFQT